MTKSQIGTQTFEDVEMYLLSLGLLHFAGSFIQSTDNISHDILVAQKSTETLNVDNSVQCLKYKNRTVGDIFRIAGHYNPAISLKEVFDLLQISTISTLICADINKRVYYIQGTPFTQWRGNYPTDEFGFTIPKLDKWENESYINCLNFINIKE